MHTCLTVSNIGGLWYVEREVSGLMASLRTYCDSIHSCDVNVAGPTGEGKARCWRVELKIRVFDETVHALTRAPEGSDSHQSLQSVLADTCAKAKMHLDRISEQHHACCAHGGQITAGHLEECA